MMFMLLMMVMMAMMMMLMLLMMMMVMMVMMAVPTANQQTRWKSGIMVDGRTLVKRKGRNA
jgi:hypothetical protein